MQKHFHTFLARPVDVCGRKECLSVPVLLSGCKTHIAGWLPSKNLMALPGLQDDVLYLETQSNAWLTYRNRSRYIRHFIALAVDDTDK